MINKSVLFCITILTCLFWRSGVSEGAQENAAVPDTAETIALIDLEARINRRSATVRDGAISIDRGQTVDGSLVVLNGNAFISGTIDGDLIVINGSASLHRETVVNGDVLVFGGHLYASSQAVVNGRRQRSATRYKIRKTGLIRLRPDRAAAVGFNFAPEGWRYTRVRGHDIGLTFGLVANRPVGYPSITGTVSIPTVDNNHGFLDFSVAMEEPLFENRTLRLRLEGYKITDTNDDWHVPNSVNSVAGFLSKNDFYNYFMKQGVTASVSQSISRTLSIGMAYRHDRFKNLGANDPFTLLGGNRSFRVNPAVDEGDIHSLVWTATYNTRPDGDTPGNDWMIKAELERAMDALGSDFEFTRYDITVRRYNEWHGHHLNMRAKFAGSRSPLPLQRSYVLGALSGLRGFGDFEFAGDRLLVINTEYRIPVTTFRREAFIKWDMEIIPFFDTGTAYFSRDSGRNAAGHPDLVSRAYPRIDASLPDSYTDLRSNAGIAIAISSRILYTSIHIAQNLHDSRVRPRILFFAYRDLF